MGMGAQMRTRFSICLLSLVVASLGVSSVTSTAAVAATPHSFFGVVADSSTTPGDAARMKKAHVGSIRTAFIWSSIQPTHRGPYDWAATDNVVARAAKEHISVLPVLTGTPAYESAGCTGSRCDRRIQLSHKGQRQDWTAFVRAAATRYGRHGDFWRLNPDLPSVPIERWQAWNEENNPKQRNPVSVYSKLLALTDQAVSSVDHHGRVILGGLAGVTHGAKSTTAWNYLAGLLAHGARKHMSGVALHPYSPTVSGIASEMKQIRRVLTSKHAASIPTYITEIGWGSGGKKHGGTGNRGQSFVLTPKGQRQKLTGSFKLLLRHRKQWRVGGVYWYQWKDPLNPPPGLCAFCYSSGLYKADGTTAKPALIAYRKLAG
jgi:hypothetical protein